MIAIGQIGIVIFGMSAIALVNDPRERVRRWGPVMGCLAQPFWFYEAFTSGQWGIFACSFVYAASWARGFYFAWIKRAP